MSILDNLTNGYENTKLIKYNDITKDFPNTYYYDELKDKYIPGVLKCNMKVDGRLIQTYSPIEHHVGVIAGTRLGKTTSYVIPTIISFAKQKIKRSMIISDPKGEVYRVTKKTLENEGYTIKLLNFRDFNHTEYWNPLLPIYDKYQEIVNLTNEVKETKKGYIFRNKIFTSSKELNKYISIKKNELRGDLNCLISSTARQFMTPSISDDPYWENAAEQLLRAFIWAMLEDSDESTRVANKITRETFSFATIFRIYNTFEKNDKEVDDYGYFTKRNHNSEAFKLSNNTFINNAPNTRACVVSCFEANVRVLNDVSIRTITSYSTFDPEELTDGPIALFICFKDEDRTHYGLIGQFIQSCYKTLIKKADETKNNKLDVPFYFILDEFGNFPKFPDFDTTISACAGRNIYFMLILQSYAQLYNSYDEKTAQIIKDNLNVKIFLGSNNTQTLDEFSEELGKYSRISPTSVFKGDNKNLSNYDIETIRLVPISDLSYIKPGECFVKEVNSEYVMKSYLVRYYECSEFINLEQSSINDYETYVDIFSERFEYNLTRINSNKRSYRFEY